MKPTLIIAGILMTVCGCIGTFIFPLIGLVGTFAELSMDAGVDQSSDAAQIYCREGERGVQTWVETATGVGRSGQGVSYALRYYCIDTDGERRDVTERVLSDPAAAFDSLSEFFPISPIPILFALLGIGVFFAGVFMRRPTLPVPMRAPVELEPAPPRDPRPPVVTVPTPTLEPDDAPTSFGELMEQVKAKRDADDVETRLRELDEMRARGEITPDEYQRQRQEILDSLG